MEEKKCRLCGDNNARNINIYNAADAGFETLVHKIRTIYPIILYRNDPLPKHICKTCHWNVITTYNDVLRVMRLQTKWIADVKSTQPQHEYLNVLDLTENGGDGTRAALNETIGESAFLLPNRFYRNTEFSTHSAAPASPVIIGAPSKKTPAKSGVAPTPSTPATPATCQSKAQPQAAAAVELSAASPHSSSVAATPIECNKRKATTPARSEDVAKIPNPCTLTIDDSSDDDDGETSVEMRNKLLLNRCNYCKLNCNSLHSLAEHQMTHLRIKLHKLDHKRYVRKAARQAQVFLGNSIKRFRCKNCLRVFMSNKAILDHWDQGECEFYCKVCGMEFTSAPKLLRRHVTRVHGISYSSMDLALQSVPTACCKDELGESASAPKPASTPAPVSIPALVSLPAPEPLPAATTTPPLKNETTQHDDVQVTQAESTISMPSTATPASKPITPDVANQTETPLSSKSTTQQQTKCTPCTTVPSTAARNPVENMLRLKTPDPQNLPNKSLSAGAQYANVPRNNDKIQIDKVQIQQKRLFNSNAKAQLAARASLPTTVTVINPNPTMAARNQHNSAPRSALNFPTPPSATVPRIVCRSNEKPQILNITPPSSTSQSNYNTYRQYNKMPHSVTTVVRKPTHQHPYVHNGTNNKTRQTPIHAPNSSIKSMLVNHQNAALYKGSAKVQQTSAAAVRYQNGKDITYNTHTQQIVHRTPDSTKSIAHKLPQKYAHIVSKPFNYVKVGENGSQLVRGQAPATRPAALGKSADAVKSAMPSIRIKPMSELLQASTSNSSAATKSPNAINPRGWLSQPRELN